MHSTRTVQKALYCTTGHNYSLFTVIIFGHNRILQWKDAHMTNLHYIFKLYYNLMQSKYIFNKWVQVQNIFVCMCVCLYIYIQYISYLLSNLIFDRVFGTEILTLDVSSGMSQFSGRSAHCTTSTRPILHFP